MPKTALIVGTGSGISASFARALHRDGYGIALASRTPDRLAELAKATGARALACDVANPADVERMFAETDSAFARLDVVLFNASARPRGAIPDLAAAEVERALQVGAFGGFLVAQAAARRMLGQAEDAGTRRRGAILFTGASASVKGYARSAPFAMAKFALRGLAQSLARELGPQGIHVAHFVIDGGVRSPARQRAEGSDDTPDSLLDPDAIAASYMHVLQQPRSAWTWEVELRPWVERF
jgi:NAD(P)-dependent dehydrogenase (short-subunit alcohol dehydrogenase family)